MTLAAAALAAAAPALRAQPAEALYAMHCAACHGPARLGLTGPALLPENLERLKPSEALAVIAKGRTATQMPGFGDKLSAGEIRALADYIYTPAPEPRWGIDEVRASRVVHPAAKPDSDRPVYRADPLNLFVVVETGDHHATILDGERFEPLARFATRFALHGGPKFSPDGRFVYFGSRDGWVSKYDLYNLRLVEEVRAGINLRNIAVSSDGRFVMVANYLPHTLVALDAATLEPLKVIPVRDAQGGSSRVSAVYDAAPRQSFIAALKDLKEIWEIPYGPKTGPVYAGLVHDYRMGEGLAEPGPFPVRVIPTEDYLDDFFFDRGYDNVIGAARGAKAGEVVNLNVRRRIESIPLPGLPHLASGITWNWHGHAVLATPNLKEPLVTVIDTSTWKVVKQIPTLGPGFFLRSHENSRYAWVDSFNSPARDTLQVIDKETLEVVAWLRPAPGKTAAHVEFTRDGRYALASIWDKDGAIVVYDARTLREVKRLPMNKPSGKYNVYNKITRSDGTSH
ncbi:MAG: c-type cytochrome [Betaproteobacteria bacterium]|nr:c-type cytochrome [Betaproteobacteria bacterium]